jgi:hypothetical protein
LDTKRKYARYVGKGKRRAEGAEVRTSRFHIWKALSYESDNSAPGLTRQAHRGTQYIQPLDVFQSKRGNPNVCTTNSLPSMSSDPEKGVHLRRKGSAV